MKRSGSILGLMCLALFVLSTGVTLGQPVGSIVGWGSQVVVKQSALDSLVAVAGGYYHSLGLKSDGTIVAWGANTYGQCNVPEPNEGFVAVVGGGYHSLGLKSDGVILAWGYNGSSQCNVPAPNEGFVAGAGGRYHSLGLKSDGTIVAWGNNGSGQCNVPSPNEGFVAVAEFGRQHVCPPYERQYVGWRNKD